jgi:hypothetical protein
MKLVALGTVIAVLVAVFGPWPNLVPPNVRDAPSRARNYVLGKPQQITISSATASSSSPGHGAGQAIDEHGNTWWEAASEPQPELTIELAEPGPVDWILITPGTTTETGPALGATPRPDELFVQVHHDGTNTVTTQARAHLDDTPGAQQIDLSNDGLAIAKIELQILSTHPGTRGSVAIAEVELLRRTRT